MPYITYSGRNPLQNFIIGGGLTFPILQDAFELPTFYALCRASLFLEKAGCETESD
jgi:hypothetical protein